MEDYERLTTINGSVFWKHKGKRVAIRNVPVDVIARFSPVPVKAPRPSPATPKKSPGKKSPSHATPKKKSPQHIIEHVELSPRQMLEMESNKLKKCEQKHRDLQGKMVNVGIGVSHAFSSYKSNKSEENLVKLEKSIQAMENALLF